MATLSCLMDSFFDDDNPKAGFSFLPASPNNQKDLDSSAAIASHLSCHSSDPTVPKEGIFSLHNNLLVHYLNDSSDSPTLVLNLLHSRLRLTTLPDSTYGFQVTKNGISHEFSSASKQSIDSWAYALKSVCVLGHFHDEYMANKTLGVGGFATVCLVEAKKTKKFFAVKAFSKRGMLESTREKAKPALLNEICMMRNLDHDNIVKLYEVYETENSIYLVMELIKGKTLYEILKKSEFKNDFSESRIRDMMFSILSALAHISSHGIMHRDLKPANILIAKDDTVKIADFGLATYINAESYVFKKCGTPGYIAPEIYKYVEKDPATAYDDKCDIFSAGCIFFYMLFGNAFFKGCDASEVVKLNQNFTMNYENVWMIKKELKNSFGKLDKDALRLLLQLIELDPNIRITASQALSHPYFSCKRNNRKGSSSAKAAESDPINSHNLASPHLLEPLSAGTKPRYFNFLKDEVSTNGYLAVGLNKITEKDSLYLDISRGDSNGDSLNKVSLHSPLLNKDTGHGSNTNSLSTFANTNSNTLKSPIVNKASQGNSTVTGSKILRTAIFNNMNKQNERMNEKPVSSKGKTLRMKFGRHNTDYILPEFHFNGEDTTKVTDESCEVDDGGNEDSEIQKNVDHIQNLTKAMLPSKKAHLIK